MKPNFKYNPFSGVLAEDLNAILVPRFNIETLVSKISQSKSPIVIEFLGKKGRGKTTHLKHLHQQLKDCSIVLLTAKSSASEALQNPSKTLLIDSIHHLNLRQRIQLFQQKKNIIYTTHYTRKWECLIAKKELNSFKFNGIDPKTLQDVLNKRLLLATTKELEAENLYSLKDSSELIKKFKDNYRAIINHLYNIYQ